MKWGEWEWMESEVTPRFLSWMVGQIMVLRRGGTQEKRMGEGELSSGLRNMGWQRIIRETVGRWVWNTSPMEEPWSCSQMYPCFIPTCFSVEGKPCTEPGILKATPSCPTGSRLIEAGAVKICKGRKTSPVCSRRELGREDRVGGWQEVWSKDLKHWTIFIAYKDIVTFGPPHILMRKV